MHNKDNNRRYQYYNIILYVWREKEAQGREGGGERERKGGGREGQEKRRRDHTPPCSLGPLLSIYATCAYYIFSCMHTYSRMKLINTGTTRIVRRYRPFLAY